MNATDIIKELGLQPLPIEGGYYHRTYLGPNIVPQNPAPNSTRSICSSIYYLITQESFSRLHKLSTDEIFHFYLGDPVEFLLLYKNGASDMVTLGQDLASGQRPQLVVPAHTWQGAKIKDKGPYTLMGTTMAPAFEYADFEVPDVDYLRNKYPKRAERLSDYLNV